MHRSRGSEKTFPEDAFEIEGKVVGDIKSVV